MPKNSPTPALPQENREQSFHTPAAEYREMSELAQQLRKPETAGSYTLKCSMEALHNATKEAGFALFDADLKGIKGKQNFINTLACAAGFPPEFGSNWDALADDLCDLSWHEADGYVLLLRNASATLGLSVNDREIAQDLLADTVVYWRQRNKAFWVFFA